MSDLDPLWKKKNSGARRHGSTISEQFQRAKTYIELLDLSSRILYNLKARRPLYSASRNVGIPVTRFDPYSSCEKREAIRIDGDVGDALLYTCPSLKIHLQSITIHFAKINLFRSKAFSNQNNYVWIRILSRFILNDPFGKGRKEAVLLNYWLHICDSDSVSKLLALSRYTQ